MKNKIILYQLKWCPYCKRVRNKLDSIGLDYETVSVPRDHEDRKRLEEYDEDVEETVYALTGDTHVPVIVDEENGVDGMNQSDEIVEYLREEYE